MAGHGGIESQTVHAVTACLDEEDEELIVPLDFIDGIVVHEIAGAVKDWLPPVNLDAARKMVGVPEHDVGAVFS
jgi:hypothetical protein